MTEQRHTADTITDDQLDGLYAELAGARATIDHMSKAMSWIAGHDRQGLDHLDEAQYEARSREAAVRQAQSWAARARSAEAGWAELSARFVNQAVAATELLEQLRTTEAELVTARSTIDRVRAIAEAANTKPDAWAIHPAAVLAALDGEPQPDTVLTFDRHLTEQEVNEFKARWSREHGRAPAPCEQHPTAPRIADMCGGCTQYPADLPQEN